MKKTISLRKRLLLPILVLVVMAGCSKEKSAEKNIAGSWKTVSYTENGSEIFNVWREVSLEVGGCSSLSCTYKNKLAILDWEIKENNNATINNWNDIIGFNASTCKCVAEPEVRLSNSTEYTWELSEKGGTFTLFSKFNGLKQSYTIVKLKENELHLKGVEDGISVEYKLEAK